MFTYRTCSVHLSFKEKSRVCKFYVVEHSTAILGITDSKKLDLVRVNVNVVDKSVKVVHKIAYESFRKLIELEYPELFKGIGLMDSDISIKLKDGTIPHIEPVCSVPQAMQDPL